MKETNDSMGIPQYTRTVNGTEVLHEGVIASKKLRNGATVRICCLSCAHYRTVELAKKNLCVEILTDNGHELEITDKRMTRCRQWQPQPRLLRIGTSAGKVDHPDFIRWKCDNPDVILSPTLYGKLPEESQHDFLLRMWHMNRKPL